LHVSRFSLGVRWALCSSLFLCWTRLSGGIVMTHLPQLDCCTLLGIDPKTLRQWVRQAHLQFVAHPTDARLKCLTEAQVQQLATQHGRPLPWLATTHP